MQPFVWAGAPLPTGSRLASGDHSSHTARLAPGHDYAWEVSWLPGRLMDCNSAITAMVLADTVGSGAVDRGHRLWPHVEVWAADLRLTTSDAVARTSQPPETISIETVAAAELAGPEAARS